MGRRLLRAMGAGLMEGGKQAELSRRERLEQQKSDRLLEIQNRRLDLMGEQNQTTAAYQGSMVDIAKQRQVGEQASQASTAAFQQTSLGNQADAASAQAAENLAMIGWRKSTTDANTIATQLQLENSTAENTRRELHDKWMQAEAPRGINAAETEATRVRRDNFFDKDIPEGATEFLSIPDMKAAAQYDEVMQAIMSDPTYVVGLKPKEFDAMLTQIQTNLKTDPNYDATKVDDAVGLLNYLATKARLKGVEISKEDLETMIKPRLRPPEDAATAAGTAGAAGTASLVADVAAARPGLEDERGMFGKAPLIGDSRDIQTDPELAADVIGQGLDNMLGGDDFTSAVGTTAMDVRALREMAGGGKPEHAETLAAGLKSVEENWPAISKRYDNLRGKTFEEALPLIRQLLQMAPGSNPQTGLGLMNGMNLSDGMEEFSPGNDASLMGGFDPSQNYT